MLQRALNMKKALKIILAKIQLVLKLPLGYELLHSHLIANVCNVIFLWVMECKLNSNKLTAKVTRGQFRFCSLTN